MARSYVGALVRLRHDTSTRGGVKFQAGTLMRVIASDSHGLMLRCYRRGWPHSIHGVVRNSVDVVEWPEKDEVETSPEAQEE